MGAIQETIFGPLVKAKDLPAGVQYRGTGGPDSTEGEADGMRT